eukprot:5499144-Amphidinium_carterae.1
MALQSMIKRLVNELEGNALNLNSTCCSKQAYMHASGAFLQIHKEVSVVFVYALHGHYVDSVGFHGYNPR